MAGVLVFSKDTESYRGLKEYLQSDLALVSDAGEAKDILQQQNIKAALIDLEEQEKDGFELAAYLRGIHRYYLLPVIFLAADRSYEQMAFHEIHCFDYVTKPVRMEQMMEILNLISGRLDPSCIPKGLVLRVKDGIYRVDMSDLVYVEILNRNLMVHTIFDVLVFPYRRLGECIDQGRGELIQCHRAIAVNRTYVERLDYTNRLVILKEEMGTVVMGRKYMHNLREQFDEKRELTYTGAYQKPIRCNTENGNGGSYEGHISDTAWKTM